jgi:hypothetical protein
MKQSSPSQYMYLVSPGLKLEIGHTWNTDYVH